LSGRRVVEVDWVRVEDIFTVDDLWVYIFVESAAVERGVMIAADSEGDGVCSRGSLTMPPTRKVLREVHLRVDVEVKASAPALVARGLAAALASEFMCGGAGVVIVGVQQLVEGRGLRSRGYFGAFDY
jgi:hypothetical protein